MSRLLSGVAKMFHVIRGVAKMLALSRGVESISMDVERVQRRCENGEPCCACCAVMTLC